MKKINSKELELLVKSVEPCHSLDTQWITEAIRVLILQRIQHCYAQLDNAISKDEAFFANHLESQVIIYVDNHQYGHFGIPTYNHMVEYLEDNMPEDKLIVQQALRQYFENIRLKDTNYYEVLDILTKWSKGESDLENALTEMMLIL